MLCDLNGESYRAFEWGLAQTRLGTHLAEALVVLCKLQLHRRHGLRDQADAPVGRGNDKAVAGGGDAFGIAEEIGAPGGGHFFVAAFGAVGAADKKEEEKAEFFHENEKLI